LNPSLCSGQAPRPPEPHSTQAGNSRSGHSSIPFANSRVSRPKLPDSTGTIPDKSLWNSW
jgi:hypothetical protein